MTEILYKSSFLYKIKHSSNVEETVFIMLPGVHSRAKQFVCIQTELSTTLKQHEWLCLTVRVVLIQKVQLEKQINVFKVTKTQFNDLLYSHKGFYNNNCSKNNSSRYHCL